MEAGNEEFEQAKKGLEKMMQGSSININGKIVVPLCVAKIHARAYMVRAKRIGAESQLQALKDPSKIREVLMGADFDHLKIKDEYGFTGEWRLSEKGVLDVIITLITNLEDSG